MIDIKYTAAEIVRGMTNYNLTDEQQGALRYVAEIVIDNQFRKESRKYEIWAEGYVATGTEGRKTEPRCHGTSEGVSFEDACVWKFKNDKFFDAKDMTYWGCKLYGKVVEDK